MHHKRRRAKSRRAGCLLCKPHKANGAKGRTAHASVADRRHAARARDELSELDTSPASRPAPEGGHRSRLRRPH